MVTTRDRASQRSPSPITTRVHTSGTTDIEQELYSSIIIRKVHRGPKYLSKRNTSGFTSGLYQLAHLLSITIRGSCENSIPGLKGLRPAVAFR